MWDIYFPFDKMGMDKNFKSAAKKGKCDSLPFLATWRQPSQLALGPNCHFPVTLLPLQN